MPDIKTTITTTTKESDLSSAPNLHQTAWYLANHTAVTVINSAAILALHGPTKYLIINGNFPPMADGIKAFIKSIYAGTTAAASGSAARTAYVTTTKNSKSIEEVIPSESQPKEEGIVEEEIIGNNNSVKLKDIANATAGEIAVTQIPETLSTLRKVPGLIPEKFKWYTSNNAVRLMFNGIEPRFVAGMINFGFMLAAEPILASQLQIQNETQKHFASGALSGVGAAVASLPFSMLKDYIAVQSTVNAQKELITKSTASVSWELFNYLLIDLKLATKTFALSAKRQLPLRVALTSAIYSIISGSSSILGAEPLKNIVPKSLQPNQDSSSEEKAKPPIRVSQVSQTLFNQGTPKAIATPETNVTPNPFDPPF